MIVQEVKHRPASGDSRRAGGFGGRLDGSGQLLEVGLDGGERYAERMIRLERKEGAVGGGRGLERGEIRRRVASAPVSLEVELYEGQGNGVGSFIAGRAPGCCLGVAVQKVVKQRNGELLVGGLLREVVDRLTKALARSTGDGRVAWGFGKQFAKRCQRESVGRRIAAEGHGVGAVFGHVLDQAMDQGDRKPGRGQLGGFRGRLAMTTVIAQKVLVGAPFGNKSEAVFQPVGGQLA